MVFGLWVSRWWLKPRQIIGFPRPVTNQLKDHHQSQRGDGADSIAICTGGMQLENIVAKSLCDKRAMMAESMQVEYIENVED